MDKHLLLYFDQILPLEHGKEKQDGKSKIDRKHRRIERTQRSRKSNGKERKGSPKSTISDVRETRHTKKKHNGGDVSHKLKEVVSNNFPNQFLETKQSRYEFESMCDKKNRNSDSWNQLYNKNGREQSNTLKRGQQSFEKEFSEPAVKEGGICKRSRWKIHSNGRKHYRRTHRKK